MRRAGLSAALVAALCCGSGGAHAADETEAAWAALKAGGHVALIRHARAPGTGDPPGFVLEDCTTQRNLDEAGRRQAAALGAAFENRGIVPDAVWSSRWCRTLETARLAFGRATPLPLLDSIFSERGQADARSAAVRAFLAERPAGEILVMVTHQANITALTGLFQGDGEMIVVRREPDGTLRPIGRVPTPQP